MLPCVDANEGSDSRNGRMVMLAFGPKNVAGTKPSNQRMAEKIGSQLPESRLYLGNLSVRSPQWVILTILSLTDSNQSTQESSPNYFLTGIRIRCELSTSRIMTSRSDVVVRRIISTRPGIGDNNGATSGTVKDVRSRGNVQDLKSGCKSQEEPSSTLTSQPLSGATPSSASNLET